MRLLFFNLIFMLSVLGFAPTLSVLGFAPTLSDLGEILALHPRCLIYGILLFYILFFLLFYFLKKKAFFFVGFLFLLNL